jgi:glycosyltransferase involved in cell wall biosynthesis
VSCTNILQSLGFAVTCAVDSRCAFLSELHPKVNVKQFVAPLSSDDRPALLESLRAFIDEIIRNAEVDVVVSHQPPHAHLLSRICNGIIPHLSFVHVLAPPRRYVGCDKVVVLNSRTHSLFLESGFAPPRLTKLFNPAPAKRVAGLAPFHRPLRVGFMGRLEPEKAPQALLNAVVDLKLRRGLAIKCYIAGTGSLAEELRELAQNRAIAPDVTFLGYVTNLDAFYKEIDVFVLPSRTEQFSLVILEAFAHAKPVIATPAAGAEVISHMETGILAEPEALGDAIAMLAEDEGLAMRLAKNCLASLERWDQTTYGRRLSQVLTSTAFEWWRDRRSCLAPLTEGILKHMRERRAQRIRAISLTCADTFYLSTALLQRHLTSLLAGFLDPHATVRVGRRCNRELDSWAIEVDRVEFA